MSEGALPDKYLRDVDDADLLALLSPETRGLLAEHIIIAESEFGTEQALVYQGMLLRIYARIALEKQLEDENKV